MTDRPRNPFRNEADAFRVLMMFIVAGAIVIATAVAIDPVVGVALGLVMVALGAWRAWGLLQDWRERGSDPAER